MPEEMISIPTARREPRDVSGLFITLAFLLLAIGAGGRRSGVLVDLPARAASRAGAVPGAGLSAAAAPGGAARGHGPVLPAGTRPAELAGLGRSRKGVGACPDRAGDARRSRGRASRTGPRRRPASAEQKQMNFPLPVASNFALETDHILIALLVLSGGMLVLVFGLMFIFAFRYRAGSPLDRGTILEKTWRFETAWTAAIMLGFFGLFYWGGVGVPARVQPAGGRDQDQRGRQAVDVEVRASRRAEGDQHAARAGGRAGAAPHDLGGRDPRRRASRPSASSTTCCPAATRRCGSSPRRRALTTCSAISSAAPIIR